MLNQQLAQGVVEITADISRFNSGITAVFSRLNQLKGLGTVTLKVDRTAATASLNLFRQQLAALKSAGNLSSGGGGGGSGRSSSAGPNMVGLASLQMSGIKLQDNLARAAAKGPAGLIGLGSLQMGGIKLQDNLARAAAKAKAAAEKEAAQAAARAAAGAAKLDAIQDRFARRDFTRRVAYESRLEKAKEAAAARAAARAAAGAAKLDAIQDRYAKRDYDRRIAYEARVARAAEREAKKQQELQQQAHDHARATMASAGMGVMQGLGFGGIAANPVQFAGQMVGGGIAGGVSMLADGLKQSVSTAMDLESTFVGLQRVSGESAGNVAKFKDTIFDIAKTQAGVSVSDLTTMAMAGAKAGITDKEGLGGLETFTRGLAKVRNSVQGIGTEQLADDMTRILNLFHKGTDYVQSFGSVLARMDNVSTSSASDILDMSKSLSGTFTSLGMTIPQVMAFSSVLSDVGLTNQQGASSFSQILRMLASQSEKMAEKIGVPVEEFQQKVRTDAMGALGLLIGKFRELNSVDPVKAQEFLSELGFRGVKTAGALQQLSSMFEQVQERTKMAIEEESSLGSLQASNNLNSTTAIGNIQKLKNAFEELSDAIGSKVVPHLTEASKVALAMMNGLMGGKDGAPQDITAAERGHRALIKSLPDAAVFPSDRAAVAEIDRKEKAYNDRLNTAAPTHDEQIANLQRSKAGASPAIAAQIDVAIDRVKMDQANAKAKSPEGMAAAGKAFFEGVTKVPGVGTALGKPEFPGLPGISGFEQATDFADPEARARDRFFAAADAAGAPAGKKGNGKDWWDADNIKADPKPEKEKKFSSQMFSDPADFARHAIQTALSDQDPSKEIVKKQEATNVLLRAINGKLGAATVQKPTDASREPVILRGMA